jgi:aspartate kinase
VAFEEMLELASQGAKVLQVRSVELGKTDLPRAKEVLEKARPVVQYEAMITDPDVAKISIVGIGMRSHAGVAATMFKALSEKGINIQVISTSEIKTSVLVGLEYTELAVRALHTAYGLDAEG